MFQLQAVFWHAAVHCLQQHDVALYICSTFFEQQRTSPYLSYCQIQSHPRVTLTSVFRRLNHPLFGHPLHPPVHMWTCAKRTHVPFQTKVTPANLTRFLVFVSATCSANPTGSSWFTDHIWILHVSLKSF